MPRPGTPVVHPRMLDSLRTVAQGAQSGTCQLLRPSDAPPALNPSTLAYEPGPPVVLWSGPCRVQPQSRSGAQVVDAAGEQVTLSGYQVTVPISAGQVVVDDLVLITASADPQLVGRTLRVTDVSYGDLQAERHLDCEDDQG